MYRLYWQFSHVKIMIVLLFGWRQSKYSYGKMVDCHHEGPKLNCKWNTIWNQNTNISGNYLSMDYVVESSSSSLVHVEFACKHAIQSWHTNHLLNFHSVQTFTGNSSPTETLPMKCEHGIVWDKTRHLIIRTWNYLVQMVLKFLHIVLRNSVKTVFCF